jgi:hypothetical protein
MRFFLASVLLLISLPLFAQKQLTTQIHDIDMGLSGEEPLIFLTSGDVVTYPIAEKSFILKLREKVRAKSWFLITLNSDHEITAMEETSSPVESSSLTKSFFEENVPPYTPSILKNLDEARSFFYDARPKAREESQCFNRAHVWVYEWRKNRNLYSSKAWLFFTKKFIRKYKYKWWFHIAPMVHVVVNGKVRERVMDIKYARGPLMVKQWTDIFMTDNSHCPVVERYSDYADFPESASCFLMKTSMYYYQPLDIETKELTGTERTHWREAEVRQAFIDAYEVEL